jgi:hypothetical protein
VTHLRSQIASLLRFSQRNARHTSPDSRRVTVDLRLLSGYNLDENRRSAAAETIPPYTTVIECEPAVIAVVASAAFPLLNVRVPKIVVPFLNITVPVGVPVVDNFTVAVNVRDFRREKDSARKLRW